MPNRSDVPARARRRHFTVLLVAIVVAACGAPADEATVASSGGSELPSGHPPVGPDGGAAVPAPLPDGEGAADTSLSWQAPEGWIEEPPANSMRRAQYRVPGSGGDAECVVFYFGPGQGGDATSNAARWAGQFTQPDGGSSLDRMTTESFEVGDVTVTLVEVSGTYSGGSMTGPPQELADHALLGAIAEGADANWFFKFTGPSSTVLDQREAFLSMIRSLTRGSSYT